jgi:cell division protein FtsI/penicillin-binding protein 2
LFLFVAFKLIYLQVFQASHYSDEISALHYKESLLKASRGDIYIYDKGHNAIPVTKNISVYDIFIEPQYFNSEANKEKFVALLTPYVYEHLCVQYGVLSMTPEQCVQNLEAFTDEELLPQRPEFFYFGSGVTSEGYEEFNRTGYNESYQEVISGTTQKVAESMIMQQLNEKIILGTRPANYLGFFEDVDALDALAELPYVEVYNNYAYVTPSKVISVTQATQQLTALLTQYQYKDIIPNIQNQLEPKENTYVKLITKVHPRIANQIIEMKEEYRQGFRTCYEEEGVEDIDCQQILWANMTVPLLHGLGLEQYDVRYYPYDDFAAHILWFVTNNGDPLYGVEEYMNAELAGQDGKIIGRSSNVIGEIGANEFDVEKAIDGNDIYLTIDQNIQKYTQDIAEGYSRYFRADSISIVVMDPHSGEIKAMTTAPWYNPNNINSAFRYVPVSPEEAEIIDNISYIDLHLFIKNDDGTVRKATTEERQDPAITKWRAENMYGSEVFVDRSIKYAYEPWSVFKPLTVAIGIDSDEIDLYDFYQDKGSVTIDAGTIQYTIRNISSACLGDHTYLNALTYSCNVGMIKIIQEIGRPIFYNYLQRLW